MRTLLALLLMVTGLAVAADAVPPGTNDEIRARLKPFGALCRAGDSCGAPAVAATGTGLNATQIYDQFCVACHASGAGGAPKLGDGAAWAPRIGAGLEAMVGTAISGKGGMPPRGTCMNCTDDELETAVQYIVDKSK